jgi:hypothetical protein
MEFLSRPSDIITTLLTIISLGLLARNFIKRIIQRSISYETLSNIPILNVNEGDQARVQLLFDNKPVRDARLVTFRIWNSGSPTIQRNDYLKPTMIEFGTHTNVLEADVIEMKPNSLRPNVSTSADKKRVILKPMALKSNESITFKVALSQSKGDVFVNTTIKGIKEAIKEDNVLSKAEVRRKGIRSFLTWLRNICLAILGGIFVNWVTTTLAQKQLFDIQGIAPLALTTSIIFALSILVDRYLENLEDWINRLILWLRSFQFR